MAIHKGDQLCNVVPNSPDEYVTITHVSKDAVKVVVEGSYKTVYKSQVRADRFVKKVGDMQRFTFDPSLPVQVKKLYQITASGAGNPTVFDVWALDDKGARRSGLGVLSKKWSRTVPQLIREFGGRSALGVSLKPESQQFPNQKAQ